MSVVWKVVLIGADVQEIEVPSGAEILCAREQHDNICVWYRCDPMAPKVKRTIAVVGTGYAAPDNDGRYIGSASLQGGNLIFHVFEKVC